MDHALDESRLRGLDVSLALVDADDVIARGIRRCLTRAAPVSGAGRAVGVVARLLGVAAVLGVTARATASPEILISGDAQACPTPAAVAEALAPLVPHLRVRVGEAMPEARVVHLQDGGPALQVAIGATVRILADPSRVCSNRARLAAVFIALVVAPPSLVVEAPASTSPPAAAEVPVLQPTRGARVSLEAVGMLATAPTVSQAPTTGGGVLRLRVGARWFGVALGGGVLATYGVPLSGSEARVTRVPFDLDPYVAVARGPIEVIADVGLALTLLRATGSGFARNDAGSGLEWGVRAGLGLGYRLTARLGARLGVEGVVVPRSVDLASTVTGKLASTPGAWLGVSAGLFVRLD